MCTTKYALQGKRKKSNIKVKNDKYLDGSGTQGM